MNWVGRKNVNRQKPLDLNNKDEERFHKEIVLAIFSEQSENLRTYRRDQVEALVKFTTIVVAIFAAAFFVEIGSTPPNQGSTASTDSAVITTSARIYALIFGAGVPGLILCAWLVWLDLVLVQEMSLNRREMLRYQTPEMKWPDSVHVARLNGEFKSPRAVLGKLGGGMLFIGSVSLSLLLTYTRLWEHGALQMSGKLALTFGAMCLIIGIFYSVRVYKGLRNISLYLKQKV